jgi:MFS family permease
MSVGYLAVGFVGTCLSWILLSKFGRRRIYNVGLATLSLMMFIIAILDCAPNYENRPGVIWAQSTIMVIWNGIYDLTIGPVCFAIICEVSATKVRSRTIAVATAVQALMGIVMTVAIPYMINPDQANMRGKLGFFFGGSSFFLRGGRGSANVGIGGLSAISFVWAWFRVPETKGRTYEELDLMFEKGVKTREFKHYKVV